MPLKNILITGTPGVGKTTLIRRLAEELEVFNPTGFYTSEIRDKGVRAGFELIGLDGRSGVLSHTGIKSPHSVGKYRVDVEGFEKFLEGLPFFSNDTGLVVIDEIGKMECLSDRFRTLVSRLLDSDKPVVATIALKGGGAIDDIKKRSDIKLFEVTLKNRDKIFFDILYHIKSSVGRSFMKDR